MEIKAIPAGSGSFFTVDADVCYDLIGRLAVLLYTARSQAGILARTSNVMNRSFTISVPA